MNYETYYKVLDAMLSYEEGTIETALCCCEQGVEDFMYAYYLVMIHNSNLIRRENEIK